MSEKKAYLTSVVVTPEDLKSAIEFFDHFNIPKMPELMSALDAFEKDQTIENQINVRTQLCKAIAFTDHPAFKDDMFTSIVQECESEYYRASFDEEVEKTLSSKTEES
jgi:hypothetical protein